MASCSAASAVATPILQINEDTPAAPLLLRTSHEHTPISDESSFIDKYPRDARYRFQKVWNGVVVTVSAHPDGCGVPCSREQIGLRPRFERGSPCLVAEEDPHRMNIAAGCVVLNHLNQLLVVVHPEDGMQFLPGGPLRLGETFDMAIRRLVAAQAACTLPVWPAEIFHCLETYTTSSDSFGMQALLGPFLVAPAIRTVGRRVFELDESRAVVEPMEPAGPEWIHPAELYARLLTQLPGDRAVCVAPGMMSVFTYLAKRYRTLYEFAQQECYCGAREACSDSLMFDLCHMEINDGSIHRNDTHQRALKLARERLSSNRA